MSGNFAIKGGGVGPLMANAILNFHFDYLKPSLMDFDNRKVYGDTSITDSLVLQNIIVMKNWKSWYFCTLFVIWFATPAIFKAMGCLFCKKTLIPSGNRCSNIAQNMQNKSDEMGN